jgi:mRNA interferase RelE/StbE
MAYRLEISRTAHRQVLRIPVKTRERINEAIMRLADNPRPHGVKKLTDREGYRIRVGDFRVLYQINDSAGTIIIYRVMSRGDVYRF